MSKSFPPRLHLRLLNCQDQKHSSLNLVANVLEFSNQEERTNIKHHAAEFMRKFDLQAWKHSRTDATLQAGVEIFFSFSFLFI